MEDTEVRATDRTTQIELNPLKQVSRDLSQLGHNVAISNHKFPSKLLFTHFMERSEHKMWIG
jgi:hypothetical protein